MTNYQREMNEIIEIVNRPHGCGGELPRVTVSVLPADRAEQIIALDRRVQQVKWLCPMVIAAGCAVFGWAEPVLAGAFVAAYLIQGAVKGRG